jgi:hypothetical protein
MAFDADSRKKLQIVLLLGIAIAGARAAWVVYERHEARKEVVAPRQQAPLKADDYVTPKRLHPYDLKSARELTKQPVWAKVGGQLTYYPYDRARHRSDWGHEAGTLGPLQKLEITDVLTDVAREVPGMKEVMARFDLDGTSYAVPIGAEKGGEFKIYSDDIFFIEDPRQLYKHWPSEIWKAIDAHRVQPGMTELQASFAIGLGVPVGSGDYGWRTLRYANDGKPVTITFENDKAGGIKAGK